MNTDGTPTDLTGITDPVLAPPKRPWARILGTIGLLIVVVLFAGYYYKSHEAAVISRDSADLGQIARNIRDGKGFTTRFIRPFCTYRFAQVSDCPEVNNAPLFPYALATMFKLRGVSDQVAVWTSLAFLILSVLATYLLGYLLFGWRVGLLAAVVVGVSDSVLSAATSAEEWTLATLLFTLLLISVALHHRAACAGRTIAGVGWATLAALLVALLYMTNHILIALIIPIAVYFGVTGSRRWAHLAVFLGLAVVLCAPWAYRNTVESGVPVLGMSAWDLVTHTGLYPGDTFYRTTDPANRSLTRLVLFPFERFEHFTGKLMRGSVDMFGAAIPMLGFVALPFAVVCVLYRFKQPSANAIRGLLYGAFGLMMVCFGLYSVSAHAVIMFAPILAVLASAYLFLLLDARKLHRFFFRALVVGFAVVTAGPAIVSSNWPAFDAAESDRSSVADKFFAAIAARGITDAVYTDAPWTYAWRTNGVGVWVPRTDADFTALSASNIPLNAIVLTPESDGYSPDEMWYLLHRSRMWRDYIADPASVVRQITPVIEETRRAAGLRGQRAMNPKQFLERFKRGLAVSQTVSGLKEEARVDPGMTDYVIVFVPSADKR